VEIKNHVDIDYNFDFQNITAERVEKIINKFLVQILKYVSIYYKVHSD
jgi:hypothetical protein